MVLQDQKIEREKGREMKGGEVRTIKAVSERLDTFKNTNDVRQFSFLIDEPQKLGGTDEAPTPMEYVLGSFNGCLLIVVEMVAKELNFSFQGLKAHSSGTVDRRGLFGTAEVSPHFQEVVNTVYIETDESDDKLEEIKAQVRKRCPAYNLFHDAGINIVLDWHIVKEER